MSNLILWTHPTHHATKHTPHHTTPEESPQTACSDTLLQLPILTSLFHRYNVLPACASSSATALANWEEPRIRKPPRARQLDTAMNQTQNALKLMCLQTGKLSTLLSVPRKHQSSSGHFVFIPIPNLQLGVKPGLLWRKRACRLLSKIRRATGL